VALRQLTRFTPRWFAGCGDALAWQPLKAAAVYAASAAAHVVVLGGLALCFPGPRIGLYSSSRGAGGTGQFDNQIGSAGGAAPAEVVYFHLQPAPRMEVEPAAAVAADESLVQTTLAAQLTQTSFAVQKDETAEPVVTATATAPDPTAPLAADTPHRPARHSTDEVPAEPANQHVAHLPRQQPSEAPPTASVNVDLSELQAIEGAGGRGVVGGGTGAGRGDGNGGGRGLAGGSFDVLARSIARNPKPLYPLAARVAHMEGTVYVRFQIAADGTVIRATLDRSSGWPLLDDATLTTVREWRFDPMAEPCELRLPFEFFMRRS
jgi:protein TonB